MFLPATLGDVSAGAKPHPIAPECIFEKLDQSHERTSHETIMKTDRHYLRGIRTFLVE
jgi:hypothetical protein